LPFPFTGAGWYNWNNNCPFLLQVLAGTTEKDDWQSTGRYPRGVRYWSM